MNSRNLTFFIVLISVWIAGYYYYWPESTISISVIHSKDAAHEDKHRAQFDAVIPQDPPAKEQAVTQAIRQDTDQSDRSISPTIINNDLEPLTKVRTPKSIDIKKNKKLLKKRTKKIFAQKNIEEQIKSHSAVIEIPREEKEQSARQAKIIPVINGIVKKDIGYYKMLSWHYPHLFTLTVNDQTLFNKNNKTITSAKLQSPADKPLVIRYDYEWHTPWGKRIGAKKVTFQPNLQAEQLIVRFTSNWKNEERIVVDGATKISDELLEEEEV